MANNAFGLDQQPFNNTPNPARFVNVSSHRSILDTLHRAIDHRKGLVLLTGAPGTGKTMLTRLLKQKLGAGAAVTIVSQPCEGVRDLWMALYDGFRMRSTEGQTISGFARDFKRFAEDLYDQDIPAVAVFDAAHQLSDDCLDLIRQLADMEADDMPLVQIVLVGWPKLKSRFLGLGGAALQQRIYRHIEIQPLNAEETRAYIEGRLSSKQAATKTAFTDDAYTAIHERTGGIPRLINAFCDTALTDAYNAGVTTIDANAVRNTAFEQSYDPELYEAQLAGDTSAAIMQTHLDRHPLIRQMMDRMDQLEKSLSENTTMATELKNQQIPIQNKLRRYDRVFDRLIPILRELREFRQQSQQILKDCQSACEQLTAMMTQPASLVEEMRTTEDRLREMSQNIQAAVEEAQHIQADMVEQTSSTKQNAEQLAEEIKTATPILNQTRQLAGVMQKVLQFSEDRCKQMQQLNDQAKAICEILPDQISQIEKAVKSPMQTLERLRITDDILRKRIEAGERLIDQVTTTAAEMREAIANHMSSRLQPYHYEAVSPNGSSKQPEIEVLGSTENLTNRVQELRNMVQSMRRTIDKTTGAAV